MMSVIDAYRAALAASHVADPIVVAKAVVDGVPDAEVRDALADALVALAPVMISTERSAIRAARQNSPAPASRRWRSAAEGYNAAILRMRLATPHGHIFLGDATVADLDHQERTRRAHAAATLAQADWFAQIAQAMRTHGAAVVRDLPADVLVELESLT